MCLKRYQLALQLHFYYAFESNHLIILVSVTKKFYNQAVILSTV